MTPDSNQKSRDDWFDKVIRLHQCKLVAYANRILDDNERAKDTVQDAFMKLYQCDHEKVKPYLAPWLYRVVRNRALNIKRKEKRMIKHESPETLETSDYSPRNHNQGTALLDMVHTLPPPKNEIVMLKFKDGFSYKEIASITGLSVSNVGYQLHHAIRMLKSQWEVQQIKE